MTRNKLQRGGNPILSFAVKNGVKAFSFNVRKNIQQHDIHEQHKDNHTTQDHTALPN